MFRWLIFDFDGTLVDSKEVLLSIYNEMAKKNNFKPIHLDDIESLRKLSVRERCKVLNFPMYKIPFLSVELYRMYRASLKNVTFFPKVKELLGDLKEAGYHMAIISSNAETNIREFVQEQEIDYIQAIFCSNNIFGKDKVIKRFLDTHNLERSEVIYVGDELRDIVACKKSGIKVIWVGWGYDLLERAKREHPDYIVQEPSEILDIVRDHQDPPGHHKRMGKRNN